MAIIHVQEAAADGTCRIEGLEFQDVDYAVAAKYTIVSCERLISQDEMRSHPERNTIAGICVDAVVPARFGAHPSQCFGYYDYDSEFYWKYDHASRTQADFDAFIEEYVEQCPDHAAYLDKIGAACLESLEVQPGWGYRTGLKRK